MRASSHPRGGQAAVEFALLYSAVVLPLTFMLVYVSQMLWIWHSVSDYTRGIAHFAATHCWQSDDSASNVLLWATNHVPPMIDQDQFQSNAAGITVSYFAQAADGTLTPFACETTACVPDMVSISITSYQYNRFSGFFGLPSVKMPPFTTTVPMESGGYQDASGTCVADAPE
jgi:Flp pilus assembly protein TadG